MKEILQNLALINLTEFGKENNIDISGTHLAKNGRGFKYSLVNSETGRELITVCFHKTNIPTFSINPTLSINK